MISVEKLAILEYYIVFLININSYYACYIMINFNKIIKMLIVQYLLLSRGIGTKEIASIHCPLDDLEVDFHRDNSLSEEQKSYLLEYAEVHGVKSHLEALFACINRGYNDVYLYESIILSPASSKVEKKVAIDRLLDYNNEYAVTFLLNTLGQLFANGTFEYVLEFISLINLDKLKLSDSYEYTHIAFYQDLANFYLEKDIKFMGNAIIKHDFIHSKNLVRKKSKKSNQADGMARYLLNKINEIAKIIIQYSEKSEYEIYFYELHNLHVKLMLDEVDFLTVSIIDFLIDNLGDKDELVTLIYCWVFTTSRKIMIQNI